MFLSALLAQRIVNPVLNSKLGNYLPGSPAVLGLQLILRNLLTFSFSIAGLYFFYTLLRGGYEYITAGSDKEAVQRAQKRLTNGFMGIIIVFSIFALIFVVNALFGINIRIISIPTPQ